MPSFQDDLTVGDGTFTSFQAHPSITGDKVIEVFSSAQAGTGVFSQNIGAGVGVHAVSAEGHGVHAINGAGSGTPPTFGTGLWGESDNGFGLFGSSGTADAIVGITTGGGRGVLGESSGNDGVQGRSHHPQHAGMSGVNDGGGIGIYGSGATAGRFDGPVAVNGDFSVTGRIDCPTTTITCFDVQISNADCAEDFTIGADLTVDPGTVMVLGAAGEVFPCTTAYDKRVAGVVSGAGDYRPGLVLDRHPSARRRLPIALMGKVFCKVDAGFGSIEVGDMLTTSPTAGHAMKANDRLRALGTVIGKSLCPLAQGSGLIPILVTLQ